MNEIKALFSKRIQETAEAAWMTAADYPAVIVMTPMGHRCGYVLLPEDHAASDLNYRELDVRVHGGVTYGEWTPSGYVVGFDCAHFPDAPDVSRMSPAFREMYMKHPPQAGIHRSLGFCVDQCESLAKQLKELE